MSSQLIELNGADSQYDRWLRALNPDYARVDGRSLRELQRFAADFGRLIYFYDLLDRAHGGWRKFFLAHPRMVKASLATTDLAAAESRFGQLEQRIASERSDELRFPHLRENFHAVHALAIEFDDWLEALCLRPDSRGARLLGEALATCVDSHLGTSLRRLKALDADAEETFGQAIGLDWQAFGPRWQLDTAIDNSKIHDDTKSPSRIPSANPNLQPLFNDFVNSIMDLQAAHSVDLEESLDDGETKPQLALYFAFTILFRHAQATVNTFSDRYARFYYDDVLRETHRGPVADSLYLTFQLADDEEVVSETVPQDTLFPAGQDEHDNEILYGSDQDLLVTAARIAKLRAIRVVGDSDKPEPSQCRPDDRAGRAPPRGRDVFATEIFVREEQAEAAGELVVGPDSAWPTFGAAKVGTTDFAVTTPATLGFAIASSYLLLTGGTRHVKVCIDLSRRGGSLTAKRFRQGFADEGSTPDQEFVAALKHTLKLYASTSGGWFEVRDPGIDFREQSADPVSATLTIRFTLDTMAPPILPYDPDAENDEPDEAAAAFLTDDVVVNASSPAPTLPTLKVYLSESDVSAGPEVAVAESLLSDWDVNDLHIHTHVKELADLQLQNTDGLVDQDAPFLLFGGLPTLGSYMLMRQPELFAKRLSHLNIRINWFNLPQNDRGFYDYYYNYVIDLEGQRQEPGTLFNNRTFTANISVQDPGDWTLRNTSTDWPEPCGELSQENAVALSPETDYYLFRTGRKVDECAAPTERGALWSTSLFYGLPVRSNDPPNYYQPEDSALKLELAAPKYAFGNDLYPQNVLNAVIEDLPNVETCCEVCCTECRVLADAAARLQACVDNCSATTTHLPIRTWTMIGSWNKLVDGAPEFDVARPPELHKPVRIKDRVVKWRKFQSKNRDGRISLGKHFTPNEHTWAMAYAAIDNNEDARTVNWHLGSDDQAIVWVNGIRIYDYQGERRWNPNDARGSVELQHGINHIWFQTGNSRGRWEFSMAVGATPIMTWYIIGAWDKVVDGAPEFDVARAPDLHGFRILYGKELTWQELTSENEFGMLAPGTMYQPDQHAWAMAYANVHSDQGDTVSWQLGSDDQAIVWANGVKIYDYQGERSWNPNDAQGSVDLQQGDNNIWFQTGNSTGPWEFSMAVGTTFRKCLEDCLSNLKQQLRIASITCFFCCVAKTLVGSISRVQTDLRELETRLHESQEASADEASRIVREFLEQNSEMIGEYGVTSIEKCWQGAVRVWQAANRVGDCEACVRDCGMGDDACMIKCVERCIADLTVSYEACLKACIDDCMKPKPELKYPNEPYLPQVESLTIDYRASCSVPRNRADGADNPPEQPRDQDADLVKRAADCAQFFHLLPFDGDCRLHINSDGGTPLLPQFPEQGNLYLGFARLQLPQTLTLLFQMATGAEPSSDRKLPRAEWWYLADNRWHRQLDRESGKESKGKPETKIEVLADSTNGLHNSGVVTLRIPEFDSTKNTILSADYRWLRVTAKEHAGMFPGTVAVYPHCVAATWRKVDDSGEHLRNPLPPYTITSSVETLSDIATISQPMASFGGRPRENRREFQVRLGERLRHKDRAALSWDYERLVLEQFPAIWKVQTLAAHTPDKARVPGCVLVVVVPGPHGIDIVDSTTPTAPGELLLRIEEFLRCRTSPFVELKVVNPNYVRITVDVTVSFYDAQDTVTCINRLNDELVQYLSPWFYDATRAARQGRYTSEADVAEFILTRPYVKSLSQLSLRVPDSGCSDWCFRTSAHTHQIHTTDSRHGEEQTVR